MSELNPTVVGAVAAEYVSTVLGVRVEGVELPVALADRVLGLLSRREEIGAPRDAWGNWEGPLGKPGEGFGKVFLDREILNWGESAGKHRIGGRWPGGAEWALCLTHDMDFVSRYGRWREASLRLGRLARGGENSGRFLRRLGGGLLRSAGGLREDPWWCFEKWIELAHAAGGRSTWMIFPEKLSRPHPWDAAISFSETVRFGGRKMRVREMIREISSAGMEIGLHPSIHAARDAAQLRDQRRQVEDAAGCEVTTVRQHFLRWDADCTPGQQVSAGLKVDSTLGFNRGVGFRMGGCFPYQMPDPATGKATGPVQIPLQLMDVALFSADGLGLSNADQACEVALAIMAEVRAVGGVLVLNWHPNSITEMPMIEVVHTILGEARRSSPWVASLGEVAEHWSRTSGLKKE